jgi:hypothetical protein
VLDQKLPHNVSLRAFACKHPLASMLYAEHI